MVNSREYRNEENSHEISTTSILLFFFLGKIRTWGERKIKQKVKNGYKIFLQDGKIHELKNSREKVWFSTLNFYASLLTGPPFPNPANEKVRDYLIDFNLWIFMTIIPLLICFFLINSFQIFMVFFFFFLIRLFLLFPTIFLGVWFLSKNIFPFTSVQNELYNSNLSIQYVYHPLKLLYCFIHTFQLNPSIYIWKYFRQE